MLYQFNQTENLYGEVFVDGKSKGECFYQFQYNPYEPHSMEISLFNPPVDVLSGKMPTKVITEFHWGSYEIELKSGLFPISLTGKGKQIKAPVTHFFKRQKVNREVTPAKLDISYLFPLTSLTDFEVGFTQHGSYGLVRGHFDEDEHKIGPIENPLIFKYKGYKITLSDEFNFKSIRHNYYPQEHIVRRSFGSIQNIDLSTNPVIDIVATIDDIFDEVFKVMSLIEREWIDWNKRSYSITSEKGDLIEIVNCYRFVKPPSTSYRPNWNEFTERRKTLKEFLSKLVNLDTEKQKIALDTLQNYKIANTAHTVESQFIHWHSCLDFFKKHYLMKGESTNNFSKDLIKVFDNNSIPLDDVLKHEPIDKIREAIKNKGNAPILTFTELRNAYIHDGFDAFHGQYDNANELKSIMRALAERLLTRYIGLESVVSG